MRHKQAQRLEGRGRAAVVVEAFVMLLFCTSMYVCVYGFFQSTFALLIITLLPLAQAAATTATAGGEAIKGC